MPILRLAIPSPLRAEFDYLPPANMGEEQLAELKPGIRVRVPFGRREVIGYLHYGSDDIDRELLIIPYIELGMLLLLALIFMIVIKMEMKS